MAISLAVAESQLEFEHRDLHLGNILVSATNDKTLKFCLNGKSIKIRTHGIKATIIDYSLSRIMHKKCRLFQDLGVYPQLFQGKGDYQFDIYRLMRKETKNNWGEFRPFTNMLWLHYLIDKMTASDEIIYTTARKSARHHQLMEKMITRRKQLLDYHSAMECAEALP